MSRRLSLLPIVAGALAACATPTAGPAGPTTTTPPSTAAPPTATTRAEPTPPTLRLPDDVVPSAYKVRLDLDPDRDTFTGHVDIEVTIARATDHVWLHATGLTLSASTYTIAGVEHPLTALANHTSEIVGFRFAGALAPGAAVLHFDVAGPVAVGDVTGLFRQQDGGRWYIYSQLEATFARRIVPSFDEPRWKTPWQVTLVTPAGQQAFTNTPVQTTTTLADGRVATTFAPTPPMPSYLLAVAVGPFDIVDGGVVGRGKVPSRVIVPAGRGAEAAYAIATTGAIVAALETYFDRPLPLAKLDQIAIPTFIGAMENPGLITYSSGILLAAAGHDSEGFRRAFIHVAGHELAHQWFGNDVTLAWWDDIWLNEAFATWMASKVAATLDPRWDGAISQAAEAAQAMAADVTVDARPIRRPIKTTEDILGSFDAMAYQKGGAVLAMFERWVGAEKFRDGVRAYLAAHARGVATSTDFLAALASVSTPELSAAFATFLDQPGVPLVEVGLRCEPGAPPVITLSQQRLAPAGATAPATTWTIPVCVRAARAPSRDDIVCQLMTAATAEIKLDGPRCPAMIVGNDGASGYYRVRYQGDLAARITRKLPALSAAERLAFASDTGALVESGTADLGDALALAATLLKSRDGHTTVAAVNLIAATEVMIDDAHLPAWRRWVLRQVGARARKAGLLAPRGESAIDGRARHRLLRLAITARDPALGTAGRRLALGWLDGTKLPADDLGVVLAAAAITGDAALHARLLAAATTREDPNERLAILAALGGFEGTMLVEQTLQLVLDKPLGVEEIATLLDRIFARPETQGTGWAFVQANFDAFAGKLPAMVRGYIAVTAAGFCSTTQRADAEAFLRPRVSSMSFGERALGETLARIDRCVALRMANAAAVARAFPR